MPALVAPDRGWWLSVSTRPPGTVAIMSDNRAGDLPESHRKFCDDQTVVPSDLFDQLLEDLADDSDRAPTLARAAKRLQRAKTYDTIDEFFDALDD